MSNGASPLFIDTGAFYAHFDEDDQHHDRVSAVFDKIRNGDLAYRPLYTSQAVLAELTSLILYRTSHADALNALTTIRSSSSINVLVVDKPTFGSAVERFGEYDDHDISLVDHTTGVLADERDIEHVFAFDSDFRTLGFTRVPGDTGDATR